MTSGGQPTWRQVADALAERLSYAVRCDDPASHGPGDCPFCADVDAYELWAAKAGRRHPNPFKGASTVSVFDLVRDPDGHGVVRTTPEEGKR